MLSFDDFGLEKFETNIANMSGYHMYMVGFGGVGFEKLTTKVKSM